MKIFKRGAALYFGYKTVETIDPRKLEVYCKPHAMRRERLKCGLVRGKPLSERFAAVDHLTEESTVVSRTVP